MKRYQVVYPEEKSVDWVEELVNEFYKSCELNVDLIKGTCVAAKTCPELLRCPYFVDCKSHAERNAASAKVQIETQASQDSNKKSDISCSDEMLDVCKIVVRAYCQQGIGWGNESRLPRS